VPGKQKKWRPITRQICTDVAKNGRPDRIDTFNGNYGLNRGLASACLVLAVVALAHTGWWIGAGLCAGAAIYGYRAYRFGVRYARERFLQFLVLYETLGPAKRRLWQVAPQARPRHTDRTRSSAAVSRNREHFKCPAETMGDSALSMPQIGAERPVATSRKPAIFGPFCEYWM
jgi:hypothetical protein